MTNGNVIGRGSGEIAKGTIRIIMSRADARKMVIGTTG